MSKRTTQPQPKFSRKLLSVAVAAAFSTLAATSAQALQVKVVDGKTGSAIATSPTAYPIGYRWLLQEDQTYDHIPGQQAEPGKHLSLSFYKASHPVIATGTVASAALTEISVTCPSDVTPPAGGICVKVSPKAGESRIVALDPAKRYFITVLPDQQFSLGAVPLPSKLSLDADPNLQTRETLLDGGVVEVPVYRFPIPTAQMSVFVFEDNLPTNNQQDLPNEHGLGGFEVKIIDAGGTYGASGGQQHQDAFGNPIGTEYVSTSGGVATTPSNLDLSSGGPVVSRLGSGVIYTGQCDPVLPTNNTGIYSNCGVARVKWLAPGKYSAVAYAPPNSDWIQTTTIEGTPVIDAWVKANEPTYFQEFGPPGHHVFTGFVHTGQYPGTSGFINAGNGKDVTGRIVNRHMSRPPEYAFYNGEPVPDCWIAVNDVITNRTVYTAACAADSIFNVPGLKPGSYTLAVWDKPLDRIFATYVFTVPNNGGTVALGDIAVFDWFGKIKFSTFFDNDTDGFRDAGEPAYPGVGINLRFRDGSIYNGAATDMNGELLYKEVFPFMFWLGMDIATNQGRVSGMTYAVDAGGAIPPADGWNTPSFGWLTPQPQAEVNPNTGNNLSATYKDQVFTGAFQLQLGQRMSIDWGRTNWDDPFDPAYAPHVPNWADTAYAYDPNDVFPGNPGAPQNAQGNPLYFNGGIGGQVRYGTTRAENNPQDAAAPNHNPGVARVQLNLYRADPRLKVAMYKATPSLNRPDMRVDATHPLCPADVDNYPFGWSEGGTKGPEDVKQACSETRGFADSITWSLNDAIDVYWSDSWDDAVPTECPANPHQDANPAAPENRFAGELDCYDNLRSFNHFRPYVAFDGTYAFGSAAGRADLPAGSYIVEAVTPPGYETQKVGDLSVLNGDSYVPQPEIDPGTPEPAAEPGVPIVHSGSPVPLCVGDAYLVPKFQTLFPLHYIPNDNWTHEGQTMPLCDRKLLTITTGANSASDFHMYTEVPIAAQGFGMILDDTANEFDPASPNFGEKYAPPHMPVSLRDWAGKEIGRYYSDQYGRYNFLTPSTFTANVPNPSGMSPNILQACMNSPGPIPVLDADGNPVIDQITGQPKLQIDPQFDRRYSQWCYQMQYLTGKVTFLDTPVVPVAAFAGADSFPVDCEYDPRTPTIYSVNARNGSAAYANNGPWLEATGGSLQLISVGTTKVANPDYDVADPSSAKLIDRDFGFGAAGYVTLTAANGTVTTLSTNGNWSNDLVDVAVPAALPVGQYQLDVYRAEPAGAVIKSRMGISVHVGGTAPILSVRPGVPGAIQAAIDAAPDGALIMIPPGNYEEMLIMPKKVRLQGWGAFSTHLNPIKYPYENLQAWRNKVAGLVNSGAVSLAPGQGNEVFNNQDNAPVLFDGQEGPGVLVLGNNNVPQISSYPSVTLTNRTQPQRNALMSVNNNNPGSVACVQTAGQLTPTQNDNRYSCTVSTQTGQLSGVSENARNQLNPLAAINCSEQNGGTCTFLNGIADPRHWANAPYGGVDGIGIFGTDTGGGVALNAYTQSFHISNNRLASNYGLYGGGIRLGSHDNLIVDANGNEVYSDAQNNNALINNNQVILGGSEFGGGGGMAFYTGANSYQVKQNWVCGNFTMGNGGGIAQMGLSRTLGGVQSTIDSNLIAFNQSFFQGNEVHGGGMYIAGQPALVGVSASVEGAGSVTISHNTLLGNNAGAGDGGGIALDMTNPRTDLNSRPITIDGNIIANNVAGAAGGGIAMRNQSGANIRNNEIAQNDSTGTANTAFTVVGNPNASSFQPAGVVLRNDSVAQVSNNRILQNRTFRFVIDPAVIGSYGLVPSISNGEGPYYWDLARMGSSNSFANGSNGNTLTNVPGSYVKFPAGGNSCNGTAGTPLVPYTITATTTFGCTFSNVGGKIAGDVSRYAQPGFNTGRNNGTVLQAETTTGIGQEPLPAFALDEGGNWINVHYGPLGLSATQNGGTPVFDADGKPTALRSYCLVGDLNCAAH